MLTALGALIWAAFSKKEPEVVEEQLASETFIVKGETPIVEEKTPEIKQPERVIINETRLRTIFDSKFMSGWTNAPDKMYINKIVEDLQFVRDNYEQGARDKVHFSDRIPSLCGLR